MASLKSELIVSLLDRLTGPSRAISAAMGRLTAMQTRNAARLNAMRGRMLEAGAVAYGLARAVAAPIRAATDFETKLEDIGQKLNEPIDRLPKLGLAIRKVARDTTQSSAEIAEGMDVLAGMGASKEDSLALLNPIGKAATAYNASITDLSQAGYAALDNLKVPAEQFGKALDAMATSGKAGAFELKDMARYFPSLGAAYQGLDQKGVPAVADLSAALQIVRKGAGDSAEAATNLGNVLQKITAPQTRKAFAKMGVNLEREMKKASKRGLTPIEAIAEITSKTLHGDLSKLGDLFQDAQVQKGLRPLIQNMDEYRKIRAEALAAQGTVEEDYQRRLQTGALATKRWQIAVESLNLAIGNALLPVLTSLANDLIPIVNRMADWADAHPALTRAIVATTAGLVALRVAGIAAQFGLLWMKGGLISAGIGGLRILAAAFSPVTTALRVLRFALLGTGIGAALAAVALAGTWIYNNWSNITAMFKGFGDAFMLAISPLRPILDPVIDGISSLVSWIGGLLGPIEGAEQSFGAFGIAAGRAVGNAVMAVVELPGKIAALAQQMYEAGKALGKSIYDGVVAMIAELAAYIEQKLRGALNAVTASARNLASKLTFGLIGGSDKGGVDGARAGGGPVRAGGTYLVGERGPELFTPGRSGAISPYGGYAAARAGSASGGARSGPSNITVNVGAPVINAGGITNVDALARKLMDTLGEGIKHHLEGDYSFPL
jgi:TP901 family phage tail tape measure protein